MVVNRKIIFRRTILDIPLIIFLSSQFLSTIVSVDPRTSFLGYYSRFHGGFLSMFIYALLYWAYTSNIKRKEAIISIYVMSASAVLVSIYAILEHFGIDKNIWIQDVQNRVFSTLGQPNWLAAWLVALIPLTWSLSLLKKGKVTLLWITLSSMFFLTLLYTKSRSGILGFAVAGITYFPFVFLVHYKNHKSKIKRFIKLTVGINAIFLVFALITGTPWTPPLSKILQKENISSPETVEDVKVITGPALEVGGTASGEIRKIVWSGALEIFKAYPILGTGVETFAFSYYNFRPVEHNLVSEWDFLYNKAHNEYLNYLATTGTLGTGSYLFLIFTIIFLLMLYPFARKSKHKFVIKYINNAKWKGYNNSLLHISLLCGFSSILVTNFFGFSVVPVGIQFFIFPAIAHSLTTKPKSEPDTSTSNHPVTKSVIIIIILVNIWTLYQVGKYWYVDYVYAQGKALNDAHQPAQARPKLLNATKLSPKEAIYWDELSKSTTDIAVALSEQDQKELAQQLANSAVFESGKAIGLSQANVNLKRNRASMFIKLSTIKPNYLLMARETLEQAVKQAPTEAKLLYNLGLIHARTGETEKALEILEKTVEMKPNYRHARYALGVVYNDVGENEKAINELEYILKNINPDDFETKRQLDEFRSLK